MSIDFSNLLNMQSNNLGIVITFCIFAAATHYSNFLLIRNAEHLLKAGILDASLWKSCFPKACQGRSHGQAGVRTIEGAERLVRPSSFGRSSKRSFFRALKRLENVNERPILFFGGF